MLDFMAVSRKKIKSKANENHLQNKEEKEKVKEKKKKKKANQSINQSTNQSTNQSIKKKKKDQINHTANNFRLTFGSANISVVVLKHQGENGRHRIKKDHFLFSSKN